MTDDIIRPMGLKNTSGSSTPDIPGPVLHTFSSERRSALNIPANTPFYEGNDVLEPVVDHPRRRFANDRHHRPDDVDRGDRLGATAFRPVLSAADGR